MPPTLALGSQWVERYLTGIMLLHSILGIDGGVRAKGPVTPEQLVRVLNEIAADKYVPSNHFAVGGDVRLPQRLAVPQLEGSTSYLILTMRATTRRNEFVSVSSGGIAFEDPVWAILAAHAVSKKQLTVLPQSDSSDELWSLVPTIVEDVRRSAYKPTDVFALTSALPDDAENAFGLATISADQLRELRRRGMQSFPVSGRLSFFELFFPRASRR